MKNDQKLTSIRAQMILRMKDDQEGYTIVFRFGKGKKAEFRLGYSFTSDHKLGLAMDTFRKCIGKTFGTRKQWFCPIATKYKKYAMKPITNPRKG